MCFIRNMSILSRSCSPHLEHLSIICRPFYLPREFSSIIVTAVYIPPQADTSMALSKLHDVFSGYINKHPDAAFIIAGDFNKTSLRQVMPNCHQHVRAVVLESGLEMFFYRLGLVLDSLVFGLGLVSDLVIGLAKCSSWSRPSPAIYAFFLSFKTKTPLFRKWVM